MNEPRPWETAPEAAPVRPAPAPKAEAWVAGVLVPGGQALLLTVPVSIIAFMGAVLGANGDLLARLAPAFGLAVISGCLTFLIAVVFILGRYHGLWLVEQVLDRDLDGDGVAGKPPAVEERRIRVLADDEATGTQHIIEIESVLAAAMPAVARAILGGALSIREISKQGGISDPQARALHAELLKLDLTRRTGPAQNAPVELTRLGRAVLRAYAEPPAA